MLRVTFTGAESWLAEEASLASCDHWPPVLPLDAPWEANSERDSGGRGGRDSLHLVLHTRATGSYSHHLQGEADSGPRLSMRVSCKLELPAVTPEDVGRVLVCGREPVCPEGHRLPTCLV